MVTMVWVVSRIRLKVETSITRSHKSINSDWIHERDLLAGGDLTTLTAGTSAHRVPSTLIADYRGGESDLCLCSIQEVVLRNPKIPVTASLPEQSLILVLQPSSFIWYICQIFTLNHIPHAVATSVTSPNNTKVGLFNSYWQTHKNIFIMPPTPVT